MEIQNIIPIILFITFVHFYYPCQSELCHPEDKKVLLQIKQAFNNPRVFSRWDPKTDCCADWTDSLKCDETTHRITSFMLLSGDLSGPIPSQFGDLPYLDVLWLHKQPNLTGPIPRALTKLNKLRFLVVSWANLSGPVPDFLSEMKNLEDIQLSFNNLSGPIPESISKLPKLTGLSLDRNKLTGPIPDSFGEFQGKSFYLDLSHNQISGNIPFSLGNMMEFNHVDLSRNHLGGDASVFFGSNKKSLQYVDFSRNLLEFDLSNVEFPENLFWLDLNHNKISGTLPVGLASLKYFQFINVSYNRLCEQIPVGGPLKSLDNTSYFHNRCLCGAPLEIC
uniref:Leucine-rich repeat-containing N-terminal plant-type domain-containing protein n=1 Tax=Cannabis sativa TaxID=3483 RepID=A0A803QP80_CANSA